MTGASSQATGAAVVNPIMQVAASARKVVDFIFFVTNCESMYEESIASEGAGMFAFNCVQCLTC